MDKELFEPLGLKSEPLCSAMIYVEPNSPGDIGVTPWQHIQAMYIKDGVFEGPKMKGKIRPGGGDWPLVGLENPGAMAFDVRAVWETDDGALLYLNYEGRMFQPPDVLKDMMDGKEIDPSRYYFRVAPMFRTSHEKYAWINNVVAVGVGRLIPGGVAYQMHEIK